MKRFGCRTAFAIEVGDVVDAGRHFSLNFYLRDVHLNWADNQGHLDTVADYFPSCSDERGHLDATGDSLGVHACDSVESALAAIMAEPDLYQRCSRFGLGPVTDSFDLIVLPNATEVLLVGVRNDEWNDDDPNLTDWNEMVTPDGQFVHWLSIALAANEYIEIIDGARQAILDLKETSCI